MRISTVIVICIVGFLYFALKGNRLKQKDLDYAKHKMSQFAEINNKKAYIIIDYRMPIYKKRLWVFDGNNKVILNCHVTHAHKSGLVYAKKLSNTPETELSCAGVFETQEAYHGSFGKSMRINGLEPNVNNNTRERNIVFHPIPKFTILGIKIPEWLLWYSDGCFATQNEIMTKLVDNYADGTYLVVLK